MRSARTSAAKAPAKRAGPKAPAKALPQQAAASAPSARATRPSKAPKAAKPSKAQPQPKLVRDGYTMPGPDFALIAALKSRALAQGRETKKSEVLRAGLHVLAALDPAALLAALNALAPVKIGRPRKHHGSD